MPEGLVRTDLNTTGVDYKDGNPITLPKTFGNTVTWTPDPAHFGNPVPASDASFDSTPVTWSPDSAHFGNVFGLGPGGFLLEDGSGLILLEDGSKLLLE